MANCVSINTTEFKELQKETGLNTKILQSKVSIWQDVNGLEKFPSKEQIFSFTPVSKRLGINKKQLNESQTIEVKKKVRAYNKKNGTNVFVSFSQQGQSDLYTWNIINEGIPVTTKVPKLEKQKDIKRATSVVDTNLQERLFKGERETSTQDILTTIVNSEHPLKDLARTLLPLVEEQDIPVRLEDASVIEVDGVTAIGYYNHTSKSITMADKAFYPGGKAESTILHEILHALSWSKLGVSNADIIKDFRTLFEHAKENSNLRKTHSYDNLDEFFVAIFTNSTFIKDLKSIPASNIKTYPNAFVEVLDKILNLLGLKSGDTAYDQAFNLASNILTNEVVANPESMTEDAPATNEEIMDFFMQMDLADLVENVTEKELPVVDNQAKIDQLRVQEIQEFEDNVANAGSYVVNGKINADKVKASNNLIAKEIYAKYDNLISPLLQAQKRLEEAELAEFLKNNPELIEGKTVEQYLKDEFTEEENQEIEELQEGITDLYSDIQKLKDYVKSLEEVQKPGAVLGTTEFGGKVKVTFTSVEQAVTYFETRIQELEQQILEEGESAITNGSVPVGITQPHYDAYLKQKEGMLSYVENSLKNLYKQKSKFKSTKFNAKIKEFRTLKDNLVSDIFDYNTPNVDKLNLIERFFKQDVDTLVSLLKNPTIDNYFLAKDLLEFMQKISDPTKEGNIEKNTGNVMTPYLNPNAFYSPEVLRMLEGVRSQIDKAQMLVKNAGETVLMELLEKHESKLKSIYKTDSLDEIRQELKKELSDITKVESYLFATGENLIRENNILDSLLRIEYEVEENKAMSIQTAIKTSISIAESKGVAALEAIGESYALFSKPGKYADKLIEKFSDNYESFIKAVKASVDTKIYAAVKNKDWLLEQQLLTQKFNLLNNDTEFIDIGLLHEIEDGSGNYSVYQLGTSAQAAAYKTQLIDKIGQIEYDNILETQRNNLDAFQQDLDSYIQYKLSQEGVLTQNLLSPEAQKNITIFEARSNPLKFVENFKMSGNNLVAFSMGTQSNTVVAKLTYNTYIPRKVDLQGNPTGYFDSQFDKIANNPDILALYTAIRKGVYQIEDNLRGSGVFVNAGDIPTFKKTITDTLLDKGWLGAMKQGLPTSLTEIKKFLLATVTLAPVRSFLGRQLSGTSEEFGDANTIVTPTEVNFDNTGDNKTDLALVVKAALEFSAVHKARAEAKDKVRLYMEESRNIKDSLGRDRVNEMERQKFFYDQLVLNKRGKKQYGDISGTLIAWERKMSGKPFSKSRMFYKYFTSEQKVVYREALKAWNALKNKGFSNLTKQEEEDRIALENTMEMLGSDYFLSTIYTAIAVKLAIGKNLALNIPAQIFNKINGWTTCVNRDGRYWPKGSVYSCSSFLHKKPMMKHVDEAWKKESDILRLFIDRLSLINDGTSELERAEGKLRKRFNVLYPMGLMQWAEDSNQTLGILCMATGLNIKDKQGNEVPLFTGSNFNGYTIKDGNLELLPEFDTPENREMLLSMSSESFLNWKSDTKETLQELNGDYSHTGYTRVKGNVLMAPFMLYKTWLPRYLGSRWRGEQKNIKTGTVERGFMLEALKGKTSGGSGFLLGATSAVGFASAMFPGLPLIVGTGLVIGGVGRNIARSRASKRALVPDTDDFVITWQKQAMFVLQTLLRTPATPINMIAGRELIEGSEKYLGLDESKLNQKTSALAARDVARNLQYSLTVAALHFAIQAAFGPPDEEKEKKGEEGSKQRKRWEAQQERLRKEHPYFNFAANALERMLQETNTCLDPTILATTFGSKNTLEGSFDSIVKLFQAINRPEDKDIIKGGKDEGQSKTAKFIRASVLPATVRQLGAEGGFAEPFKGWRAGFENITEGERNLEFYSKTLLRTTDFKKSSATYKAELAIKMPVAKNNVLESWGYSEENEVPVKLLTNFKKQVKAEAVNIIKRENLEKDLEDKIFVPKRRKFDENQMKKE